MAIAQLNVPKKVFSGKNAYTKIGDILQNEGTKKVALITDEGIKSAGLVDSVLDLLKENHINVEIFYHKQVEPNYHDVDDLVAEVNQVSIDYIIAVGGGSVLDVSKLVSVLKGADYKTEDLLEDPSIAKKQIKTILIPTTAGTGSEATLNAIVGVPEQGLKIGIVNEIFIPDVAILDVNFVKNLPKNQLAGSSVDALCHCVECFTSNKANSLSNTFAGDGARLIFHNIREAYTDPSNVEARSNLLQGSFYGGVAITSSGTTAVHALSYPLGGKFHVPHGVSNAILFEKVMRVNKPDILEELAELANIVYPEKSTKSVEERADLIIAEIADIVKTTEIPTDLSSWGVSLDDLDFLVEAGSSVRRLLDNNKRELTKNEITDIYKTVLTNK